MSLSEPDPKPATPTPPGYERPDPERPSSAAPTEQELENESPGGFKSGEHDPYAALRLRDYRFYLAGWIISVIGQQVQTVAVEWDIYSRMRAVGQMNRAIFALGLVGAVLATPVILLAIPSGMLADRFDRRRIIMVSMAGSALASLGLAFLSYTHGALPLMYLCLFFGATANAVGWPARSALLPLIVPAEAFSNATTWNSSAFQISAMAGPALGGAIITRSVASAYVADAICAMAFFVFLTMLSVQKVARKREPVNFASLAAGVRFVWHTKIILATITLDLFAVLLGGATALLPAYAQDILRVGSVGFGWLRAAPAIGALFMALWLAHRPPMQRAGRSLLLAVGGFGIATIIFGLSPWFWLSFLMLLLTGAFDNVSVVVRHTLVQLLTPDEMRGRVSAVNNVFIGASNELGAFESGLVGRFFGAVASVVSGGIGTILVVAGVALTWPDVRKFGSLQDAKPLPVPEPNATDSGAAAGETPKGHAVEPILQGPSH